MSAFNGLSGDLPSSHAANHLDRMHELRENLRDLMRRTNADLERLQNQCDMIMGETSRDINIAEIDRNDIDSQCLNLCDDIRNVLRPIQNYVRENTRRLSDIRIPPRTLERQTSNGEERFVYYRGKIVLRRYGKRLEGDLVEISRSAVAVLWSQLTSDANGQQRPDIKTLSRNQQVYLRGTPVRVTSMGPVFTDTEGTDREVFVEMPVEIVPASELSEIDSNSM